MELLDRLIRRRKYHSNGTKEDLATAEAEIMVFREVTSQPLENLATVQPRAVLCQQVIRHRVEWNSIPQLPLPPGLVHYVKYGPVFAAVVRGIHQSLGSEVRN